MTNSKLTKRALLSSVMALILCFTMLLGTTFAWFTDTASTGVNKIESGNLDMEVYHKVGDSWELIDGATNLFCNVNGGAILWEPGVTATETFKIVNNGNLAFKYAFFLNYSNATTTEGGKTLADVLTYDLPGYVNISNDNQHLEDFKAEGALCTNGAEDTITVNIAWVPGTNDNDYNVAGGLSIDLGVKVYATQYTYESDSIDNQYDKDATLPDIWDGTTSTSATKDEKDGKYHITSAAEFINYIANYHTYAVADAREYVLDCDIDLGGYTITTTTIRNLDGQIFDGQNHTVSNFTIDSSNAYAPGYGYAYGGLFGYMAGYHASTIKNLVVRNATVIGGKQTGVIIGGMNGDNSTVENCKVYDCEIIGAKKVGAVVGYTASGIVKDCYAENCNVYCAENDADECGEVIGFINTEDYGAFNNTSNNKYKKVTVTFGTTAVVTATSLENAVAQNATNIIFLQDITLTNPLTISGKTLTIDGKDHKLTGNVVSISNSNVTIKDLKITGITSTSAILDVASGSNVSLEGNTEISNNKSDSNIIAVTTGSQLTATGNVKINNNTTDLHVLFVSRKTNSTAACSATLNNVEIKGNAANGNSERYPLSTSGWSSTCGLIAVSDNSTLTINGGNIESNTVKYCTAGVLTTRLGTINLNGVSIKNNKGLNHGHTDTEKTTECTCDLTTCISSWDVGSYGNVGQITISADCVLEGTNHGSGMGGYVAGQAYNNRDYWPSLGSEGEATRPAW